MTSSALLAAARPWVPEWVVWMSVRPRKVELLQLGRRVAAVEARQRARVPLADQQPVGVEALELAGVVDVGDRNDRACAAREGVRGHRERTEDVDDDREAAGALRARARSRRNDGSQPAATRLARCSPARTRFASTGCSFMTTTLARLKKLKSVALAQV